MQTFSESLRVGAHEVAMDKKIVGLLGAASVLAAPKASQAMPSPTVDIHDVLKRPFLRRVVEFDP